jgi:hypothetical protein
VKGKPEEYVAVDDIAEHSIGSQRRGGQNGALLRQSVDIVEIELHHEDLRAFEKRVDRWR